MARMNKVGTYKTTVSTSHGGWHTVTFYNTEVVKWNERQNVVILDSGGFMTATTKTRMNQASNQYGLGFRVFQTAFRWNVLLSNGDLLEFTDGMEFPYCTKEIA